MNFFTPENYRGSAHQANAFFYWLTKLGISIPENEKFTLLDSGCGDGAVTERLLNSYPSLHVIGFDASEKQVQGAIHRCKAFENRSDFRVETFDSISSSTSFRLNFEPVDLVIANYSLHLAPSMERAIRNLTECLKPGGELLAIIPVAAPLVSPIFHEGMKDPRFAKYLVQIQDKVHDEHPCGLRFWEEEQPKWMKPSIVRGISQIAISSGLIPLTTMSIIRHDLLTEEALRPIVKGINPFLSLIPEELQAEFQEMSFQTYKRDRLFIRHSEGTIRYAAGEELVLHARKL